MAKSNLLKEAIADAKAVRETAIANARLALEEAFTPKIQSMLSKKIEEEADEDMDDTETVEEQSDSSNIGSGDNKVDVADGDDEEKSDTETTSAAYGSEDSNNTTVDKLTEEEDEDHNETKDIEEGEEDETTDEMSYKEDEEMEEEDLDLEAIIRELEDEEVEETEDVEGTEEMEETETEEDPTEMAYEAEEEETTDEEEELDLDEIIKSLKEEDDDEEVNESEDGMEGESEKVSDLTEKLEEAYGTIKSLKGTINEVNLLNAKLLFSNKLFKSHNLTEGQKMKIIETFDRAQSTREVKLVYSTLAESLSSGATKKRTIKESFASKTTRSTKPSPKTVIVEADQFTNRMKKLAGLL